MQGLEKALFGSGQREIKLAGNCAKLAEIWLKNTKKKKGSKKHPFGRF